MACSKPGRILRFTNFVPHIPVQPSPDDEVYALQAQHRERARHAFLPREI